VGIAYGQKTNHFRSADGLIVDDVGEWAPNKHARVQQYIKIASGTRAKYVPPPSWRGGASYIELFSGPAVR
jgi:hypothetical protein